MMSPTPLLIVDDNVSLANAYEPLLGDHGFRVLAACNGRDALTMCDGESCKVVLAIVDMKMPDLDGPATIAALQERSPGMKVIAVSGGALGPYFSRLSDLGVRHFVPKPFTLRDILFAIGEVTTAEETTQDPASDSAPRS